MKCPNPVCEGTMIWGNDFDLDDDEIVDDMGNSFIILSCYHCPSCHSSTSIPHR